MPLMWIDDNNDDDTDRNDKQSLSMLTNHSKPVCVDQPPPPPSSLLVVGGELLQQHRRHPHQLRRHLRARGADSSVCARDEAAQGNAATSDRLVCVCQLGVCAGRTPRCVRATKPRRGTHQSTPR